jgi:hypothetical protein
MAGERGGEIISVESVTHYCDGRIVFSRQDAEGGQKLYRLCEGLKPTRCRNGITTAKIIMPTGRVTSNFFSHEFDYDTPLV